MRRQVLGDGGGVFAGALHAQVQGLDAAQDQKAVLRPRHGAAGILDKVQALGEFGVVDDQAAVHDVGVAADVFGCRVQHDVGAQIERILQERRSEGVVHAGEDAAFAGDRAHCFEVHDIKHGIGRRLDPEQSSVRADRVFHRSRVAHIDVTAFQSPCSPHAQHLAVGAAVQIVDGQHFIAGFEEFDHGVLGSQAGTEANGGLAVFQRGEVVFERMAGGVLRTRIFVPFVIAGGDLHVGGGLENGRHDGPGRGVGFDAGVDDFCGEFHV